MGQTPKINKSNWAVCVHVCMWYEGAHVHLLMEGIRSMSGFFLSHPWPQFLRQDFPLNLELTHLEKTVGWWALRIHLLSSELGRGLAMHCHADICVSNGIQSCPHICTASALLTETKPHSPFYSFQTDFKLKPLFLDMSNLSSVCCEYNKHL